MKVFECVGCGAYHKDHAWRYKTYEDRDGLKKDGWFCSKYFKPSVKEWIPDRIKEDRDNHFKDTIQPWRDNEPSREYQEAYPDRAKKMFTEKERKTSKYVWRDIAPSKFKGGTK
jgi:hypothetical protein